MFKMSKGLPRAQSRGEVSVLLAILIAVACLVIGLLGGYYLSAGKVATTSTTASIVPTEPEVTATTAASTANWKTFNGGTYSIKYPTSITATLKNGTASFTENDGTPAILTITEEDNANSLSNIIQDKTVKSAISNSQKTTFNTLVAYEGIDTGLLSAYGVYLTNNGKFYSLVLNTNNKDTLAALKQGLSGIQKTMLSTFQFTQ